MGRDMEEWNGGVWHGVMAERWNRGTDRTKRTLRHVAG